MSYVADIMIVTAFIVVVELLVYLGFKLMEFIHYVVQYWKGQ